MNLNPIITAGCAFLVLIATTIVLVLVARATKWKPKPIEPGWGILVICAAVFLAGLVCSIAGKDIHILYWWLLGLPIAALFLPLIVVFANLGGRLINTTLCFIYRRRHKHESHDA